jgi:hypothetical protein
MDELGDLVDVTTLAVALIGVGGTLGGTLGGAVLSQRVTREQNQRADRERAEDRHDPFGFCQRTTVMGFSRSSPRSTA